MGRERMLRYGASRCRRRNHDRAACCPRRGFPGTLAAVEEAGDGAAPRAGRRRGAGRAGRPAIGRSVAAGRRRMEKRFPCFHHTRHVVFRFIVGKLGTVPVPVAPELGDMEPVAAAADNAGGGGQRLRGARLSQGHAGPSRGRPGSRPAPGRRWVEPARARGPHPLADRAPGGADGRRRHQASGRWLRLGEINNLALHEAFNGGGRDRIHFIFEVFEGGGREVFEDAAPCAPEARP